MGRKAWWATVRGVAKSWTHLTHSERWLPINRQSNLLRAEVTARMHLKKIVVKCIEHKIYHISHF